MYFFAMKKALATHNLGPIADTQNKVQFTFKTVFLKKTTTISF